MKLHLPPSLCKALVACLAALAACSVPFTVASGSALASFFLSQRVAAADPGDSEWEEALFEEETTWDAPGDLDDYAGTAGIKKIGSGTLTIGSGVLAGSEALAHRIWLYEGGLTFGTGLNISEDIFVGTGTTLTTSGSNMLSGTVVVDGMLSLAGETQIGSLEGSGAISAADGQTLRVGAGTFSGTFSNISLNKTTEGTLSLSGENLSLQNVTLNGGSLALAHSSVFSTLTMAANTGIELAEGVELTVSSVANTAFAAGSVFRLAEGASSATLNFTGGLSIWTNSNNVHFETAEGVNVVVSGGEMLLGGQGATHSIGGTLTLNGNINITGGGSKSTTAYLKQGGSVSGDLTVNTYGILYLGKDLTIGRLVSNNTGSRYIRKDEAATGDVFLIFNSPNWTTVEGINTAYTPNSLSVEDAVGYGTASSVTLTTGGTIEHAFKVSGGNTVLTLGGEGQTYSFKSIVGNGALALSAGVLSLGKNSSISALTMAANTGIELAEGVELTVSSVANTAFAAGSAFRLAEGASSATLNFTGGLSIWTNSNNVHFETAEGVNVVVSGGEMLLGGQGATHSIGGTLTLNGNINITGGGSKSTTAYLKQGGSVSGDLTVNTYGILYLGKDLTIGRLVSNNTGSRYIRKDEAATGDVFLIFNNPNWTTVEEINAAYTPNSLSVEDAVGYGAASSVTLTTGGTIEHAFKMSGSDTVLTLSGEGEVYIFNSIVGDGLLQVEGGARLQLSGSSSLSNLTLNGMQTMDQGSGSTAAQLTLDSLTLGADAVLSIGANGLSTTDALIILNPGATVIGSSLALNLDAWTELSTMLEDVNAKYVFRLFSGLPDEDALSISNLSELALDDDYGTWEVDFVDGNLVFTHTSAAAPEAPDTLYWAADAGGTWSANDEHAWAADDGENGSFAFAEGKSVVFGSGAAIKSVIVEGAVRVQNMSVESKYTFSGDSIVVDGTLTAKSGATASFGQEVTANALTAERGGFVDPAASVSFEQAAHLGTLTIENGATVSFEKSSTVDTLVHSGIVNLAEGATLTVSQMRTSSGSITGDGTLLLQSSTPWAASWYTLRISSAMVYDSDQTLVLNQTFSGRELTVRGGGTLSLLPGLTSAVALTMENSTLLLKGDIKLRDLSLVGENHIENASTSGSIYLRFDKGSGLHSNLSTEDYDLSRVLGAGVGFGFTGEGFYSFSSGSGFDIDVYIEHGTTIEFCGEGNVFTLNGTSLGGSGTLKVSNGATVKLAHISGNFGPGAAVLGTYLLNGGTLEIAAGASTRANLALESDSVLRFGGADSVYAAGDADFELNEHALSLSGAGLFKIKPTSADTAGTIKYLDPEVDTAKVIIGEGFTGVGTIYTRYSSNVNLEVDVECCYSEAEQKLTGNITGGHALDLNAAGGALTLSGNTLDIGAVSILTGDLTISGNAAGEARMKQLSCTARGSLSVEGRTLHVVDSVGGELSRLTLKGGTLKMGRGADNQLTLRALTLSDAATLSLTSLSLYSESEDLALIHFSTGAKVTGELSLALNDWAGLQGVLDAHASVETVSFALFSGLTNWFGITDFGGWEYEDSIGGVWNVAFEDGKLVFTYTASFVPPVVMGDSLIWNGSDGTWQAGESTEEWTNVDGDGQFAFVPGKSVIFGTLGQSKSIAVSGALEVQDMLVANECDYRFSAGADGEIRIGGTLLLEGSVALGVDTTVGGMLSGSGSLVVDGAVVTLEKPVNSFSGSVTLKSGVLAVNGLNLRSNTLTLEGGTLAVNSGDVVAKEIFVAGRVSIAGNRADATLRAEHFTGNGVLANTAGSSNVLSGDLSNFRGVVEAAEGSVWILQNSAAQSELGANLAGDGAVAIAYTGSNTLALTGTITGKLSLENDMGMDTTLVLYNTAASGRLVFNSNAIQLGTADKAGAWGGSVLKGSGEFVLVNGTLSSALSEFGNVKVNVAANGAVDMGGTASSALCDIVIHGEQGGRLSGVVGDIVAGGEGIRVQLRFGEENISNEVGKGEYLICTPGDLVIKSMGEGGLELSFSNAALKGILEHHRVNDYKSALHIISGGKLVLDGPVDWKEVLANTSDWSLLSSLGFNIVGAEGGDLVVAGSSMDVYLALSEWTGEADAKSRAHGVADFGILSGYKATVVDDGVTLTVTVGELPTESNDADVQKDIAAGGLLVNNLVGVKGARFHGRKAAGVEGPVTIVLNNAEIDGYIDEPGLDHAGGLGIEDVRKQNTLFEGTILGDEGVNFVKTGAGTLTVGDGAGNGGLELEGALYLRNGGITVQGGGKSHVDALIFDYESGATRSGLVLAKGAALAVNSIAEANAGGGELCLMNGARLTIHGESVLRNTSISGDGSGTLLVKSKEAGGLNLADNSSLSGVITTVEGLLTVTDGAFVSGAGLEVAAGGSLWVSNGSSLLNCELSIAADATAAMSDAAEIRGEGSISLDGELSLSSGSCIELGQGGDIGIRNTGVLTVSDNTSGTHISTEGNVLLEGVLDLGASVGNSLGGLSGSGVLAGGEGCELLLTGNGDFSGTLAGSLIDSKGSRTAGGGSLTVAGSLNLAGVRSSASVWNVHVLSSGSLTVDVQKDADDLNLNVVLDAGAGLEYHFCADSEVRLRGNLAVQGKADFSVVLNGSFKPEGDIALGLVLTEGELSDLSFTLDGVIGRALEGVLKKYDDNSLYIGEVQKSTSCIFYISGKENNTIAGMNMLWNASEQAWATEGDLHDFWMAASQSSVNRNAIDRPLAALAGASISVLGSVISHDMQRQLSAIRTRTMGMGDEVRRSAKPAYHMWINGEGSYHKLNSEGLAPGYSLNSWGGTVGADLAGSKNITVGLALSAMYGDLKVQAADSAKGDVDTTYVSAFARLSTGKWMHTMVLSGGLADVTLERTVSCGSAGYTTRGKTNGYTVGALYEAGYAGYINPDATFIVQPVFNMELRHGMLKGYSESGSDAGLKVSDISNTALSFGLGARLQALLGMDALNGGVLLESRALVKADALDHRGKSENRLLNGASTQKLESAKVGAVGVELGGGLSVLVGRGSLFLDAALELRSRYTNVDANVGYRVSF